MTSGKMLFLFVVAASALFTFGVSLRRPEAALYNIKQAPLQNRYSGGQPAEMREDANASPVSKVHWLTLKQVQDSARINPKPILIDLYTSWCGWCKVMDKKTYTDKNVTEYLQRKFYAVKLDAETKTDISWYGRAYRFNPNYRANDFSVYLTNGNLSFPTTVIIPPGNVAPQAIPGYLEPKDFEMIVKYFGEDKFGRIAFDVYQQSFKPTW